MQETSMDVTISGMDRMAAGELEELFETEGIKDEIRLAETEIKTGRAGTLDAVVAIIADHSSSTMLLLLTSWIVSKKSISLAFERQDPKTGEKRIFKLQYKQDGPVSVLKQLKSIFAE
jgi:flagellar biosynthesis protein FlhB